MIVPDYMITEWALGGGITPFEPENVNPASIDLRISSKIDLMILEDRPEIFDFGGSFTIYPGLAILATTVEYIKLPATYAGVVYLKSSSARRGLDHALAGWVDPGFEGQLTLELHAHKPITIEANQRLVQLVLMQMAAEPEQTYQGRYQNQTGPTRYREEIANGD